MVQLQVGGRANSGFNLNKTINNIRELESFEVLSKFGFQFLGELNKRIKLPVFTDSDPKDLELKSTKTNIEEYDSTIRRVIQGFSDYRNSSEEIKKESQVYEAEGVEDADFDINKAVIFKGNPDSGKNRSEGLRYSNPRHELSVGEFKNAKGKRALFNGYQVSKVLDNKGLLVKNLSQGNLKNFTVYANGKAFVGSSLGDIDLNNAKFNDFLAGQLGLLRRKADLTGGYFNEKSKLEDGYKTQGQALERVFFDEQDHHDLLFFNGLRLRGPLDKGKPIDKERYEVTTALGAVIEVTWDADKEQFRTTPGREVKFPDHDDLFWSSAVYTPGEDDCRQVFFHADVLIDLSGKKKIKSAKDFQSRLSKAKVELQGELSLKAGHLNDFLDIKFNEDGAKVYVNADNIQADDGVLVNGDKPYQSLKYFLYDKKAYQDFKALVKQAKRVSASETRGTEIASFSKSNTKKVLALLVLGLIVAFGSYKISKPKFDSKLIESVADFPHKKAFSQYIDEAFMEVKADAQMALDQQDRSKMTLSDYEISQIDKYKEEIKYTLLNLLGNFIPYMDKVKEGYEYAGAISSEEKDLPIKNKLDSYPLPVKIKLLMASKFLAKALEDPALAGPYSNNAGTMINPHGTATRQQAMLYSQVIRLLDMSESNIKNTIHRHAYGSEVLNLLLLKEMPYRSMSAFKHPQERTTLYIPEGVLTVNADDMEATDLLARHQKVIRAAKEDPRNQAMIEDCREFAKKLLKLKNEHKITYRDPAITQEINELAIKYINNLHFQDVFAAELEGFFVYKAYAKVLSEDTHEKRALAYSPFTIGKFTVGDFRFLKPYELIFGDDANKLLLPVHKGEAIKDEILKQAGNSAQTKIVEIITGDRFLARLRRAIDNLSEADLRKIEKAANDSLQASVFTYPNDYKQSVISRLHTISGPEKERAHHIAIVYNFLALFKYARDYSIQDKIEFKQIANKNTVEILTNRYLVATTKGYDPDREKQLTDMLLEK